MPNQFRQASRGVRHDARARRQGFEDDARARLFRAIRRRDHIKLAERVCDVITPAANLDAASCAQRSNPPLILRIGKQRRAGDRKLQIAFLLEQLRSLYKIQLPLFRGDPPHQPYPNMGAADGPQPETAIGDAVVDHLRRRIAQNPPDWPGGKIRARKNLGASAAQTPPRDRLSVTSEDVVRVENNRERKPGGRRQKARTVYVDHVCTERLEREPHGTPGLRHTDPEPEGIGGSPSRGRILGQRKRSGFKAAAASEIEQRAVAGRHHHRVPSAPLHFFKNVRETELRAAEMTELIQA